MYSLQEAATEHEITHLHMRMEQAEITASEKAFLYPWADDACDEAGEEW